MRTNYPDKSWLVDGLYLGESAIHGQGVFTRHPIAVGERVIRWGGVVFTEEQVQLGLTRDHTRVGIAPGLYLANPSDTPPSIDDYINHSCDGNLWMEDEITLVAKRRIASGEELTADYALWLNDADYRMKTVCNCRQACCRHSITGLDWQFVTVQESNRGHFSPFINDLIDAEIHSQGQSKC